MAEPAPLCLSLAEIEATGRKAARGAGCGWGMAEEAGRAARWLAAYGLPGAETLAACLAAQRRCSCAAGAESGPLCPIACGVALNDRAEAVIAGAPQRWDAVAQPLLTLAFAGQAAAALGSSLAMEWDAFQAVCTPDGLVLTDARGLAATRSAVEVRFCDAPPRGSRSPSPDARAVAPEAWEALMRLAHRTYVPATEAARLKGAGAGLVDRD